MDKDRVERDELLNGLPTASVRPPAKATVAPNAIRVNRAEIAVSGVAGRYAVVRSPLRSLVAPPSSWNASER